MIGRGHIRIEHRARAADKGGLQAGMFCPGEIPSMGGDHHRLVRFNPDRFERVEIGPFVSIRHDAYKVLLPFDEGAHMGWGFDFVWPSLVEQHGLRMGIIDATPVEHSMRKPVKNYQYDDANRSMKEFLARKHGLSKDEAFRIIESYA